MVNRKLRSSMDRRLAPGRRRFTRRQFGSVAAGFLVSAASGYSLTRGSRVRASSGLSQLEHIIVMMQENHSFDNYFGRLFSEGQPDAEPLPEDASNPDPLNPEGAPIQVFRSPHSCAVADIDHTWNGTHLAWNGGAMDGFTAMNQHPLDPTGSRAMSYYTRSDIPYYYDLYRKFAIGDQYFSSVLGPTFPNRYYLIAGTSFGHIRNSIPNIFADPDGFAPPNGTIFEQLDNAGVSWKIYYSQLPFAALFGYVRRHWWKLAPINRFYQDAMRGELPQIAFVDPIFLGLPNIQNDEHPPANIQVGQRYVSKVISSLFASPNWPSSALILCYDEHGGYYDHVPPPAAVPPDDIPPMLENGDAPGAFDRYGIRVPVAVISPFSRPNYVSHVVNDHTSIVKLISTRFGLPPLSQRVAAANPMLEFFDFDNPAYMTPPQLPNASINFAEVIDCLPGVSDASQPVGDESFVELQRFWNRW